MKCYHCNSNLIWGADHDIEEEDVEYAMVTNLSCSECDAFVEVYLPKQQNG